MESVLFTQLSAGEIREMFREELQDFFANNEIKTDSGSPQNKIVDLNGLLQARPFVGTRSTIYKKVSRGEIPYSKSGKRLIFDLELIDSWLLSNQVSTPEPGQAKTDLFN